MLLRGLPISALTGCVLTPQMLWVLAAQDPGLCSSVKDCLWLTGASSPDRGPGVNGQRLYPPAKGRDVAKEQVMEGYSSLLPSGWDSFLVQFTTEGFLWDQAEPRLLPRPYNCQTSSPAVCSFPTPLKIIEVGIPTLGSVPRERERNLR